MALLLRRTRLNTLLIGIILMLLCYIFGPGFLNDNTDSSLSHRAQLDADAVAWGAKMKIMPVGEGHDFRRKTKDIVEMDKRKTLDINKMDVIDIQGAEPHDISWRGHRVDVENHQNSLKHMDNFGDEDFDAGENEEDDNRILKKTRHPKGDFHRLLAKNMNNLVDDTNRQNVPMGNADFQSNAFLGYDRRHVQNCITNTVYGHLPDNLQTDSFLSPRGKSFESNTDRKESFHKVFSERHWGQGWDKAYDRVDASGRGATLSWAQEVIATLNIVINQIKVTFGKTRVRILDLPCGDMAWMSRFLVTRDDIDYTGIDIVPELIKNHRKAYSSYPWRFRLVDILEHPLQESFDIIVNRMMLQHLYHVDAQRVLEQFSRSNSTVLFSTSFMRTDSNSELRQKDNPGRIRKLNLALPPISLSPPLCIIRDGPPDTFEGWDHYMGVWELPLRRVTNCLHAQPFTLPGTDKIVYSCVQMSGH